MGIIDLIAKYKKQEKEEEARKRDRYKHTVVLGSNGRLFVAGNPELLYVTDQTTGISYKAKIENDITIPHYLGYPVRFYKYKDCDYGVILGVDTDELHGEL